jgi:endonuclease G
MTGNIRRFVLAALAALLVPLVAPAQTRDNNLGMGNPSGATTSTTNSNNYLINKSMYTLSYNRSKACPNWVSWHLSTAWYGSAPRSTSFTASPFLPSGWARVSQNTYTNSGFDRGHICPSADRDYNSTENRITFHGDNIVPQAPNNNQGPWARLEDYCRTLAGRGNELYIIAGATGSGGRGTNGFATSITGPAADGGNVTVTVPSRMWKVILVLPNGSNDVSRVTTSTRAIGVIMNNDNSQMTTSTPWGGFRVRVRDVEALTGYNFFSNVPTTIQDIIETRTDTGPTS